ncbi:hypothetical protein BC830DRAFT_454715 [Chytriomyces sp. MP71]|nr:hypothetical protein BC830DRAFT_454715 [Chytriomyces sp. MP71]
MDETSNLTRTLADPWATFDDYYYYTCIQGGLVTIAITVVEVGLLYFILWKEKSCAPASSPQRRALSPVNSLLFLLITLNCSTAFFYMLQGFVQFQFENNPNINSIIGICFFLCFQILTVFYTWNMNIPIIKITARWSVPHLRFLMSSYFLLQIALLIVNILTELPVSDNLIQSAYNLIPIVTFISQFVVFAFHAFILAQFVTYLRKARLEGGILETERLSIIARFGIASFGCMQAFLASYTAFAYADTPDIPIMPVWLFVVLYNLQQYLPLVYISIQLLMKWRIHLAREVSKQKNVSVALPSNADTIYAARFSSGQISAVTRNG